MDNAKVAEILRELWRYKDTDKYTEEEIREALERAASAFSGGEYIKKSELLQHVMTEELSDYQDCDVIHAEEIDELATYSFPDSAKTEEWITWLVERAMSYSILLSKIEKIKAEIEDYKEFLMANAPTCAHGKISQVMLDSVLNIIDKHIAGDKHG